MSGCSRLALLSISFSVALGSGKPLLAITQMLDLQLVPYTATDNRLDISVTALTATDAEKTRLTGNSEATINYELVNDMPVIDQLSFTGGEIQILGESGPNPGFFLNFGLGGNVTVASNDLRISVDTITPPGSVTNGEFPIEQHQLVGTNGTLTAQGNVILVGLIDVTTNLVDLDPFTQIGTGTIDVTQIASSGTQRTFEVSVTIPVDTTQQVAIVEGVDATIALSGLVKATDSFTITLPLYGDYNGDDVVNLADYTTWRDNLGAPAGTLDNDPHSGAIGVEQYETWKENFGQQLDNGTFRAVAVPECSTAALLALGSVLLGVLRANVK